MNNLTLVMIAILSVVAMLSAIPVVVLMQQVSAQGTSFTFSQNQRNACSGNADCSNTGTTIITQPPSPPAPPPINCPAGGGGPAGCPSPHICSMFPDTPGCKGGTP